MYDKHIQCFSNAMSNQFEANKGRGGFHGRPHRVVLAEISERLQLLTELTDPESEENRNKTSHDLAADTLSCAADIANLSLIIAWNAKALTVPVEE